MSEIYELDNFINNLHAFATCESRVLRIKNEKENNIITERKEAMTMSENRNPNMHYVKQFEREMKVRIVMKKNICWVDRQ